MTIALMWLMFALGAVCAWVARFHFERDVFAEWRETRQARRVADDVAVLRWLEENGPASPETLVQQVDRPAGRVRASLDRLERDLKIQGGHPWAELPERLGYWINWERQPEALALVQVGIDIDEVRRCAGGCKCEYCPCLKRAEVTTDAD